MTSFVLTPKSLEKKEPQLRKYLYKTSLWIKTVLQFVVDNWCGRAQLKGAVPFAGAISKQVEYKPGGSTPPESLQSPALSLSPDLSGWWVHQAVNKPFSSQVNFGVKVFYHSHRCPNLKTQWTSISCFDNKGVWREKKVRGCKSSRAC